MHFSIPIFIEERSSPNQPPVFIGRPLFYTEPAARSEKLSRLLTKLSNELHELLRGLGEEPRHDALALWTFNPLIDETTLDLRLELASGSHRRNFFFAGHSALDRKLFFTPSLPHLRFEVLPGQSLADRATAVLTRYFRDQERQGNESDLDSHALLGKARLTVIDLTLNPATLAKKPKKSFRALIFGDEEKKDGERELRKTGRPLHSMYPDDLERAIGREREVNELARLLASTDRRPILLVGPRKVGKSVIVHELVWQMRSRKKERFGGGREVWLVSPMRLISGMSVLGEWENRVLAILDHAKEKDRVLYFDDLLGLFTAGISSASDLNVAQVLKPAMEKRAVRVIAEITPESWRALRERDRAFADLFHVIPIDEPSEAETLRILVNVARQMEEQYRCWFALDVVPAVFELHRRFVRDAAFPGKAAGFLRRLAVRHSDHLLYRPSAIDEFRLQSGLHVALLDENTTLDRKSILENLRNGVSGQHHALQAFADVLLTLKARLNDPRRPLGVFLLLGPTGVGKTQAAKTLASFLFGCQERLLRFDMNEFVDGSSVARLTGTLREPEGALTSAVRRQPFSVILFDEIEKAAPEVFDLLLAVLDEGRLTDALGRVADFTQSVILLTSNLGVREAQSRLGFTTGAAAPDANDSAYISAAEKFFRPEFFNRLDRIIPFRTLDRAELERIARGMVANLFGRDGLQRRDGLLNITPAAMDRLVNLGYHPQLGARALKRVIEREVAQPIAEKLAALPPGTPIVANFGAVDGRFTLGLRELNPVERSVHWTEIVTRSRTAADHRDWTSAVLDAAYAALDRIEQDVEAHAPRGKIELGGLAAEQARYFFCREQLNKVDRLTRVVDRGLEAPRKPAVPGKVAKPKPTKLLIRQNVSGNPLFDRRREAISLRQNLDELEGETIDVPSSPLLLLLRELALLEAIAARPIDDRPALLAFRASLGADSTLLFQLSRSFHECLGHIWGASSLPLFDHKTPEELLLRKIFKEENQLRIQGLYLSGFNLRRLLPGPASTILTRRADGVGIIVMTVDEVASEAEARRLSKTIAESIDTLDPDTFGPVIQMLTEGKTLTDFRTGLVVPARPSPDEFRNLLLSSLSLPPEVESAMQAKVAKSAK